MKKVLHIILALAMLMLSVSCDTPEQYESGASGEIVYKTTDECSLGLDLLYPTNRLYSKNPTVIVLHGGGWISGERSDFTRDFSLLCDCLRAGGVTVVPVSYRKAIDGLDWSDCLEDCLDAVDFLIENAALYDIDTEKLGVIGYSAGAQLAMMTAIETGDRIDCCVSMSGPTCFTSNPDAVYYSETLEYYSDVIFTGDDTLDIYRASPLVRINRKCSTSFLLVSGLADEVVTPAHATAFERECASFALDCRLIELEELTHSYPGYPELESLSRDISDYVTEILCK